MGWFRKVLSLETETSNGPCHCRWQLTHFWSILSTFEDHFLLFSSPVVRRKYSRVWRLGHQFITCMSASLLLSIMWQTQPESAPCLACQMWRHLLQLPGVQDFRTFMSGTRCEVPFGPERWVEFGHPGEGCREFVAAKREMRLFW